MISYSIIKKSELEGAHRLDAEYYQPEYLDISKKLSNSPMLDTLAKKITDFGAYSQMNFVEYVENGVRFFRNQDVGEVLVSDNDPVFISKEVYKKLSLKLEENDILTPRVGTIGNSAIVLKENIPASANQNLAQIKPNMEKINPFYLSVFLCSRFGRSQFERAATGNVQPWLNLSQIQSVKVFVPPSKSQEEVMTIAIDSLEEYKKSKSFYSQAENLLLEELGLKDFKTDEDLWNIVNFSNIKVAGRMDAEYFEPRYEKLLKSFGKNGKPLSEVAKRIAKRIQINRDVEYSYIEIGDINVGTGAASCNLTKGKELPANAKIKIEGGELLISKVRPTRGAIAIVPEDWNKNFVASGAFSVFETDSPMREYLQVILRSVVGKLQMERPTTGTSYPTITDEDVENIIIPILPKATQQNIAELVLRSHTARKKAESLLAEAKQKVETLIEQG